MCTILSSTNLEAAAGADFAKPGDTVQVVGGHGLVLLLEEPEGGEGKAGVVAVSVLKHRGHLVFRTPVKKIQRWLNIGLDGLDRASLRELTGQRG